MLGKQRISEIFNVVMKKELEDLLQQIEIKQRVAWSMFLSTADEKFSEQSKAYKTDIQSIHKILEKYKGEESNG